MKNFVPFTIVCLLVVLSTITMVPLASQSVAASDSGTLTQQGKRKEAELKKGPEVTARVKKLKESNKQVRKALNAFEARGHKPKVEEAWSLNGTLNRSDAARLRDCKTCGSIQKISFNPQDVVSGDGVEAIFIPTLETNTDWQGTVIATKYDEYGNFLNQYVSDVAFINMPSGGENSWRGIFEVSFEGDNEWLESDPALGMITDPNFYFGTPLQEQPNIRNQQLELQMQVSRSGRVMYKPANFILSSPQVGPGYGTLPRPFQSPTRPLNPRAVRYAGCVGLAVGASVARCWIAGPFTVACVGGGTAGGAIMCIGVLIW